jgi:hypothetical protein
VKSGEDVGWYVHARNVPEMGFAVYVRPGDGDKNIAGQVRVPVWCITGERVGTSAVWRLAQADDDGFVLKFIIAMGCVNSVGDIGD